MLKTIAVAAALISLVSAGTAWAERYVVVNNQRLSQNEISQLEGWHCGPIPNGRYWPICKTVFGAMPAILGRRDILPTTAAIQDRGQGFPSAGSCSHLTTGCASC
jgi:hypothetical protein